MGSVPVGVQYPISSSLGEFLGYRAAMVSWATALVGVHRLSLRLPYLGVFPFTLHLQLDFIRVSPLRPTYLHPFGRPFTYSLFRWVSRLWYPMLWSQRRNRGVHEAEISIQIFSALAGVEPRTLLLNFTFPLSWYNCLCALSSYSVSDLLTIRSRQKANHVNAKFCKSSPNPGTVVYCI